MELEEDQKQMELPEKIAYLEARLIKLKTIKRRAEKQYEREKAHFEKIIKAHQHSLEILKQKSCELHLAKVNAWFEEEIKKENKRWKNLTPEEKLKEHKEKMGMLLQAEFFSQKQIEEMCEPMTDIMVDRWIEEENEKELKLLKKLHPSKWPKDDIERFELLQEAEKNNWFGLWPPESK